MHTRRRPQARRYRAEARRSSPPGRRRATCSPSGNAPRWRSPRRSPNSHDGHVPDDVYARAAAVFSERELGQVIAMAVTINAWNRINVTRPHRRAAALIPRVQTRSGAEIVVDGDVVDEAAPAGHRPAGTDEPGCGSRRGRAPCCRRSSADPQPRRRRAGGPAGPGSKSLRPIRTRAVGRGGPAAGRGCTPSRRRRAAARTAGRTAGAPSSTGRRRRTRCRARQPPRLPDAAWRVGSPDRPIDVGARRLASGPAGPARPRGAVAADRRRRPRRRRPGVGPRPARRVLGGRADARRRLDGFLDGYREDDGPALPAGDPWPVLEPFARARSSGGGRDAARPADATRLRLLAAACARMSLAGEEQPAEALLAVALVAAVAPPGP